MVAIAYDSRTTEFWGAGLPQPVNGLLLDSNRVKDFPARVRRGRSAHDRLPSVAILKDLVLIYDSQRGVTQSTTFAGALPRYVISESR